MLNSSPETFDLLNAFLKSSHSIRAVNYSGFDPQIVKENNYELIVFDVNQNVWNEALNYCKKIREISKGKIIILSSEFLEEKIRSFFEAGADKFLIKPFSKNELLNAIETS
jgi:DNA-binding response OmpR family regulator